MHNATYLGPARGKVKQQAAAAAVRGRVLPWVGAKALRKGKKAAKGKGVDS